MPYVLCVMQESVLRPLCWTFIGSAVLCYAYAAYVILCAIALRVKESVPYAFSFLRILRLWRSWTNDWKL